VKLTESIKNKIAIFKNTITVVTLVLIFFYIKNNQEIFLSVQSRIPLSVFCYAIGGYFLLFLAQAKAMKESSRGLDNLKGWLPKVALVNSLSSLIGAVVPSGAVSSKPLFIKMNLSVSFKEALKILSRLTIAMLACNFLITIVFLLLKLHKIWLITLSLTLLVLIFYVVWFFREKPLLIKIKALIFTGSTTSTIGVYAFTLIQIIIITFIFYGYCLSIEEDIKFIDILIINTIGSLTFVVSITPGNIGLKEALFYSLSKLLNIDAEVIVSLVVIDRVVQVFCFLLAFILSYLSVNLFEKTK